MEEQSPRVFYLVLLGAVIIWFLVRRYRGRQKLAIGHVGVWIVIFLAVFLGVLAVERLMARWGGP